MIDSIKKDIYAFFLPGSSLAPLDHDFNQDSSLTRNVPSLQFSPIAKGGINVFIVTLIVAFLLTFYTVQAAALPLPNKDLSSIPSSGTKDTENYNKSNTKCLQHWVISVFNKTQLNNDSGQQELLITKKQLKKIPLSNAELTFSNLIIGDKAIDVSWLDNIKSIIIDHRDLLDVDAFKALNLLLLHNPHISLVVNFSPCVTTIGNNFKVPQSVKNLELRGGGITSIGNGFLSNCKGLATINLLPLKKVTCIGDKFLSKCRGLTTIDLSPLSNVTSIGNAFLGDCTGLTTIDLSPLSNVKNIGMFFLGACTGLTTVDLSPLLQLKSFGTLFLGACTGLTTVDLTPLSNVKNVGFYPLYDCSGLKEITLNPTSKIAKEINIMQIRRMLPAGITITNKE